MPDQHFNARVEQLRATGRFPDARWCPSPNFGPRPEGAAISLLVVHNISLPPGEFGGGHIEEFFCNRLDPHAHPYFQTIANLQVSAHGLICRDGSVVQFVSCLDRAWHAGRSCFEGEEECNDFSIGIELEGADDVSYTDAQYQSLARLAALVRAAWPAITAERITGHCDIAPGRKTDPGEAFQWAHFHRVLSTTENA
ncbi:1,6-anhydro-N-acetylmuramyl-L-alanine amidase AmpD [Marinobacter sp. P4B1]|uniref:1,6-anhydro-N-acetylmuramyl-L-alanine amidase AmpD n=1 Tax=Marinobacter sp. P4B1 TaxID=1119533 RepID=UPI00071D68A6|nr:1,6-anhydro-N-acetylmuramyl-L-alanine amidase AmpD [Marinobacter sp. P4B1]KRW82860.1 N-acetyl-anhydromuranmyl-L-alanine amidase [Marinobacter sp. P4B1]